MPGLNDNTAITSTSANKVNLEKLTPIAPKWGRLLALLLAAICIVTIACSAASTFPTPTPYGIRLDTIPTRFQGDWSIQLTSTVNESDEMCSKYAEWYKRLVFRLGDDMKDCKIFEVLTSGELHEFTTATNVESMYQGISIEFNAITLSPLDYFDDENQRKTGFSHRDAEGDGCLALAILIPYNADK